MGQSLKKFGPGAGLDEKKVKVIRPIIEKCYNDRFGEPTKEWNEAEFYSDICWTVEEINHKLGHTQFRVPPTDVLKKAYDTHHRGKDTALTKQEFQKILEEVITDIWFTGIGAKDTLLAIFGVPVAALFLKQRAMPDAIPDEFFIPGVTSITTLVLATLNKI